MDFKKLIGKKVIHKTFKEGIIINVNDYLIVEFKEKTATFKFDCFERGYLIFEDKELQDEIDLKIQKERRVIEEKERKQIEKRESEQKHIKELEEQFRKNKEYNDEMIKIQQELEEYIYSNKCSPYFQYRIVNELENEISSSKLIELYQSFSFNGNYQSSYRLSELYSIGKFVKRSNKKSLEYLLKAYYQMKEEYKKDDLNIEQSEGFANICKELYEKYLYGEGTNKSITKALLYYKEARNCFHCEHIYDEDMELKLFNFDVKRLSKKANENDLDAKVKLANLYFKGCFYKGKVLHQDFDKAYDLYVEAVNKNHPEAQCRLGIMYFHGTGVEQNYEEGAYLFSLASEQNYVDAQFLLGLAYLNGTGVEQNLKYAFELFTKAFEQKDCEAGIELGNMYADGIYVERDIEKAMEITKVCMNYARDSADVDLVFGLRDRISPEWLTLRENTNSHPFFEMAEINYYGRGVPKNINKALQLYEKSYELYEGYSKNTSLFRMALIYLEGDGVEKDVLKAKELLEKHMEISRLSDAPVYLAELYFSGKEIGKDIDKGIKLLKENIGRYNVIKLKKYLTYYK